MAKKIQRIEKELVLKEVLHNKTLIQVHFGAMRLCAQLQSFTDLQIFLEFQQKSGVNLTELLQRNDRVYLYFKLRQTPITCGINFIEYRSGKFVFSSQTSMYKGLSRTQERIQVHGEMAVSLSVPGKYLNIHFPSSASYFDPSLQELKKEPPTVANLLQAFRESCAAFSSESSVFLFRERKPQSIVEQILAFSGSIICLPSNRNRHCPSIDGRILNMNLQNFTWLAREIGYDIVTMKNKMQDYSKEMRKKGILQELYIPILFYEFVLGYLYLIRDYNAEFECSNIEISYRFSRLLARGLMKSGYFAFAQEDCIIEDSKILDISGAGMLVFYPENAILLNIGDKIEAKLMWQDKTLERSCRIIRKFKREEHDYIGLVFDSKSRSEAEELHTLLYGKSFEEIVGDNVII